MTDRLTTEYRGVTIHYVKDHFGDRKEDLWEVWGDLDMRGNLRQCMDAIDKWELTKKIAAGMKLWSLEHSDPKYWAQYDALAKDTGGILFRNGSDPDRLYRRPMGDCALVTPEVEELIEAARLAYLEAVEAQKKWKAAQRAIPRVKHSDVVALANKGEA